MSIKLTEKSCVAQGRNTQTRRPAKPIQKLNRFTIALTIFPFRGCAVDLVSGQINNETRTYQ